MATLIVDGWNVIGSRPTGWWRRRDAAIVELLERLEAFARTTDDRVLAVFDGRAPVDLPQRFRASASAVGAEFVARRARNVADDRIVEMVTSVADVGPVSVVTADRDLQSRVRNLGATIVSPSSFLRTLGEVERGPTAKPDPGAAP